MFEQFSLPQSVPQTMFSALPTVPHTMFSVTAVPHTMLVAQAFASGLM
jgi:hypothetical protein